MWDWSAEERSVEERTVEEQLGELAVQRLEQSHVKVETVVSSPLNQL